MDILLYALKIVALAAFAMLAGFWRERLQRRKGWPPLPGVNIPMGSRDWTDIGGYIAVALTVFLVLRGDRIGTASPSAICGFSVGVFFGYVAGRGRLR
jgi:hypothetical protein